MESLYYLKNELISAKLELENLRIDKRAIINPLKEYTYKEPVEAYADPKRAGELISRIINLQEKIKTYHSRELHERERASSMDEEYTYIAGDKEHTTKNPAWAAKYNAQHRFYGMSKVKQTMAKATGQWKRFNSLWFKAGIARDSKEREEIAQELDRMFR